MEVVIQQSRKKKGKKLDAVIDGKKTVSFGATGFSDFTLHKDENRKAKYVARHQKNENWQDPKTPGIYTKSVLRNEKNNQRIRR